MVAVAPHCSPPVPVSLGLHVTRACREHRMHKHIHTHTRLRRTLWDFKVITTAPWPVSFTFTKWARTEIQFQDSFICLEFCSIFPQPQKAMHAQGGLLKDKTYNKNKLKTA